MSYVNVYLKDVWTTYDYEILGIYSYSDAS